jgi:hypothetical protein
VPNSSITIGKRDGDPVLLRLYTLHQDSCPADAELR